MRVLRACVYVCACVCVCVCGVCVVCVCVEGDRECTLSACVLV